MEPSDMNREEDSKQDKENFSEGQEMDTLGIKQDALKKRQVPVSSLSDEDATGVESLANSKRAKIDSIEDHLDVNVECKELNSSITPCINEEDVSKRVERLSEPKGETLSLPTLKIHPILGGKPLSFPVHPRLTLIDLKDFILFSLNIPHPQQILSFFDEHEKRTVSLSNFCENTLLCTVPGLIDEITGRCAIISLSFKMSSGMDFSVHPSDVDYEEQLSTSSLNPEEYFELNMTSEGLSNDEKSKISSLVSTIASLIPLPPGVSKTSKMLIRSLSKSSPTNSNLPTLWEVYFPESGIKMVVTALINVSEVKSDEEDSEKDKDKEESVETRSTMTENTTGIDVSDTIPKPIPAPKLVISPDEEDPKTIITNHNDNTSTGTSDSSTPKTHCEKCRVRCRPALRFICKCTKTFCQSHRYPEQHDCTFDHRAEGIASIQANNPKIVKDKVGNF